MLVRPAGRFAWFDPRPLRVPSRVVCAAGLLPWGGFWLRWSRASDYPRLGNSAPGPEIGLPRLISAGLSSKSALRLAEGQPDSRF